MMGGPQGAYLVYLCDVNGTCSLLSWQSRKIRRVVRSTLAGETLALVEGIDSALFIQNFWKEITLQQLPVFCFTDSKSLFDAVYSNHSVLEKSLRSDIGSIKEALSNNSVQKIIWIETKHQLADALTKQHSCCERLVTTLRLNVLMPIITEKISIQ